MDEQKMIQKLEDLRGTEIAVRRLKTEIIHDLVDNEMSEFFSVNWRRLHKAFLSEEKKIRRV